MTRADPLKCNRCLERPRAKSQRLCKPCRNAVLAERRTQRRIAIVLGEPSARADDPHDPPADPRGETPPSDTDGTAGDTVRADGANGGGNGHHARFTGGLPWAGPGAKSKVATRMLLAAAARDGGRGAKAMLDGLVALMEDPNPWVHIRVFELFRDTIEGHPGKAPEATAPRPVGRIVLHPGPDPSAPPAAAPEPSVPPGEHYEDGERFVSVPPPADE